MRITSFSCSARFVAPCAAILSCIVFSERLHAGYAEDRANKLEEAAAALESVTVDKVNPATTSTRDGLKFSKAAELHIKFLRCATGLEKNPKDGGLAFGIQCSGFTRVIDPRAGKSINRTGSDLQHVRVHIAGLFDEAEKHPKAKIDMPTLDHGSPFDAVQLSRDEIQKVLEFYFPGIEIDGVKRFEERQLAVANEGDEPLRVWVQYRTRVHVGNKYDWQWKPGEPGTDRAVVRTVAAGQTLIIAGDDEEPIRALRVHVWAESESGRRWTSHRRDELWLVDKNEKLGGERAYHAEQIETYTHGFKPSKEPRSFSERVVELKNNTPEPLTVQLRYRSLREGQNGWFKQQLTIAPGETVQPRGDGGLRVRASIVQFTAETDNRRYVRYAREPIYMVEESPAGRLYKAEKIGSFLHVFDPAVDVRKATITRDNTPIQEGNTVLTRTGRDQTYEVTGQQGDWTRIRYYQNGEAREGWVSNRNLALTGGEPGDLPAAAQQMARVRTASANVQLGDHVVARLEQGQRHTVLARDGNWVRVEVEVDGKPMQGWVDVRNLQLENSN